MKRQETGLSDSHGVMICVGDFVQIEVTCNTDFHGRWAIYEVCLRGMTPVLAYSTSEKGDQLPKGYTGCVLADKYDLKMFMWALDLSDIRPMDEQLMVVELASLDGVSFWRKKRAAATAEKKPEIKLREASECTVKAGSVEVRRTVPRFMRKE